MDIKLEGSKWLMDGLSTYTELAAKYLGTYSEGDVMDDVEFAYMVS
jgi:hypothetical protein